MVEVSLEDLSLLSREMPHRYSIFEYSSATIGGVVRLSQEPTECFARLS